MIAGCVKDPPLPSARIAPGVSFSLPPLTGDMASIEAAQAVLGEAGGSPVQFQSQIKAADGKVVVVMVDPLGRRALEIEWSADGIAIDAAPWLPEQVRPLNVLADIVIAHWPAEAVRAGLAETGARLRVAGNAREIAMADDLLMQVEYGEDFQPPWHGSLVVRNFALDYSLKIISTPTGP